ncbi:MAG: nitrous oxide reductase family maturation protein NosD, partial [Promethearchaeota archaeon]
RRRNRVCWPAMLLAFLLMLGSVILVGNPDGMTYRSTMSTSERDSERSFVASIPHDPIYIDGDDNFTDTALAEGWSGDGSPSTPFIIENLDIDLAGGPGECISILNTRVNFTIRNCVLTSGSVSSGTGISMHNVTYGTFSNNTFIGSQNGIILSSSNFNTLVNNTCRNNSQYGIYAYDSYFNTIRGNNCTSNQVGIDFYESFYSELANNTCTNNDYGIHLGFLSNFNDVIWNVLADNVIANGFDEATGNVFEYNYWSDYAGTDTDSDGIGETAYTLVGNSDQYPLMFSPTPPRWVEQPTDQSIKQTEVFHYDLDAIAPAPIFWSVNDTATFTIDEFGVVESIGFLVPGSYGLWVRVANIYGISISAKFKVEVLAVDTTSPGFAIIPVDQTIEYGIGIDIQIPAVDISGIDHWTLNDTVHFTLSATYYDMGSTGRITNNSVLEPASYSLNVTVYDPYDNCVSAVFTITIEPPVGFDPTVPLALGTGFGGAVVIVVVIVLFKRRE